MAEPNRASVQEPGRTYEPTGVGGVQCDECGLPRVCRRFDEDDYSDDGGAWLCRPCYFAAPGNADGGSDG